MDGYYDDEPDDFGRSAPVVYSEVARQAGGRHNGYLLRGATSKLYHVTTRASIASGRPAPPPPDTAVQEGFLSTAKRFVPHESDRPGPGNYFHGGRGDDIAVLKRPSLSHEGYTAGFASHDRRFRSGRGLLPTSPGPAAYTYHGTATAPGEPTIGASPLAPRRPGEAGGGAKAAGGVRRPPGLTRAMPPPALEAHAAAALSGRASDVTSLLPTAALARRTPAAAASAHPTPGGARSCFASGTARLKDAAITEAATLPGPGRYSAPPVPGSQSAAGAAFRSHTSRTDGAQHAAASALPSMIYGEDGDPGGAMPGPGAYGLDDAWQPPLGFKGKSTLPGQLAAPGALTTVGASRSALSKMGVAALQAHMAAMVSCTPGPGSYDPKGRGASAGGFSTAPSSSFLSASVRVHVPSHPGPALYRPLAVDKKSFRINPHNGWS